MFLLIWCVVVSGGGVVVYLRCSMVCGLCCFVNSIMFVYLAFAWRWVCLICFCGGRGC